MSKRDDDSQADMEVGMTTAERRRRRRRGGGLRVPSDNVPRRTTPPVVPPVPEDPSLAMSIAYSFTNDASEPVARVVDDTPSAQMRAAQQLGGNGGTAAHERPQTDPVAPEMMATVIDPPVTQVAEADFEMKTREMTAVDLESLGLSELVPGGGGEPANSAAITDPAMQLPGMSTGSSTVEVNFKDRGDTERPSDIEIDVAGLDAPAVETIETIEAIEPSPEDSGSAVPAIIPVETSSGPASANRYVRERKERLKTVALTEEDLEEVREAVRAATSPSTPPATAAAATNAPPPVPATPGIAAPPPVPPTSPAATPATSRTMPLAPLDIEIDKGEEIIGSGEIDIQELSERAAETSGEMGEIEVDVNEDEVKSGPTPVAAAPTDKPRNRPPSVPPPTTGRETRSTGESAPITTPASSPPPTTPANAHAPPPPPVQHKAPPPPPAPSPARASSAAATVKPTPSRTTTNDGKLSPRGKPWFVDLFDEDYLRTLPFLTPQATQAEAEFVIDAMGLTPGAQVLDVGCGYGRHAMELAARGFHVVGLDLSTPLLVRGGEEAHRRGLQINFVRGDMRELDFEAQFDGAYCLFSTFGYFDDETNKKTVANIARALKPGGRVMIEILNRDYLITDLPTRVWWEGDGCVVLEEVELNYFSSRIQVNRSVVFDDGRQLEQEISVRAYSLHEVGKLMHAAGFRVLEVSGGYHTRGRFFGNQSRHIIVLAERKEVAASPAG